MNAQTFSLIDNRYTYKSILSSHYNVRIHIIVGHVTCLQRYNDAC